MISFPLCARQGAKERRRDFKKLTVEAKRRVVEEILRTSDKGRIKNLRNGKVSRTDAIKKAKRELKKDGFGEVQMPTIKSWLSRKGLEKLKQGKPRGRPSKKLPATDCAQHPRGRLQGGVR